MGGLFAGGAFRRGGFSPTSVIEPYTYICNRSFEKKSLFPDKMKVAKVILLFKSGKQNEFTNYRPVSLLVKLKALVTL